jgi:hypothetical protein
VRWQNFNRHDAKEPGTILNRQARQARQEKHFLIGDHWPLTALHTGTVYG